MSLQSISNGQTTQHAMTQRSPFFEPNEEILDNSLVAQMCSTHTILLEKLLKSKNKKVFLAAIETIKQHSKQFGPALNRHLPTVLPLV